MQKLDYTDFSKGHWYNEFAGIMDSKYEDATGNGLKIYDKLDQIKTTEEFDHIMNSISGSVYANINKREEFVLPVKDMTKKHKGEDTIWRRQLLRLR